MTCRDFSFSGPPALLSLLSAGDPEVNKTLKTQTTSSCLSLSPGRVLVIYLFTDNFSLCLKSGVLLHVCPRTPPARNRAKRSRSSVALGPDYLLRPPGPEVPNFKVYALTHSMCRVSPLPTLISPPVLTAGLYTSLHSWPLLTQP